MELRQSAVAHVSQVWGAKGKYRAQADQLLSRMFNGAERSAAADRAAILVFHDIKPKQAARLLSGVFGQGARSRWKAAA